MKAKGPLWHKSSMKKGIVPCPGIDTDARWWGYSHTKKWIFGYKLHLTCTPGKIIVHLTAEVTTANVQDNKMYACSFNFFFFFFGILFTICIVHDS